MSGDRRLIIAPAMKAAETPDGSLVLTGKFIEGMEAYARLWDGRVTAVLMQGDVADGNLDHRTVKREELDFDVAWLPGDDGELVELLQGGAVAMVSLIHEHLRYGEACRRAGVPLVVCTEYSLETRLQISAVETPNVLKRWRRNNWERRLEKQAEAMIREAAGVQCNGTPTYEAYRDINAAPLLFFDSRVTQPKLVGRSDLAARLRAMRMNGPLRLAFSGRLAAMKGAHHLVVIAKALRARQVEFTFDICGGGVLEQRVREEISREGLGEVVRLRGVLDFASELMPLMKREVDLFICPHPQGDPSCTYIETMACGVPIIGYANEALAGMVEVSGAGWLTPMNQPDQLAEGIARLAGNREMVAEASQKSVAFAGEHTFEATMENRVHHLRMCAELREKAGVSA